MNQSPNNPLVLGIYGDGQLARLLALAASRKGVTPLVFSLSPSSSPCAGIASTIIQGKSWDDLEAFEKFIASIDVLALENEFVPADFLRLAEEKGIRCYPSHLSYGALSDKFKQVNLAQNLGVQVPRTELLMNKDDLLKRNPPLMLKAIRGGYDGYGNFLFKEESQRQKAEAFLEKAGPSISQEVISFDKEVAVMVVREESGKTQAFPVVETVQENSICHFTLTPARLNQNLLRKTQIEAMKLIQGLQGVGLFGIEFFIRGDEVIFNEIAPRPHNSAHLTMEACNISQFDALVFLALKQPVPMPELKITSAGMLNLLGTRSGPAQFEGAGFNGGSLHLYGKKESRPGRKMGHYTLTGENVEEVLSTLKELKSRYQI